MYNIIRKHSDEKNATITETVSTKKEAREYIKAQINSLSNTRLPHVIRTLGDVTNIRYNAHEVNPYLYTGADWSIGFWFEKVS